MLVPLHIVPPNYGWLDGRSITVVFGLIYGWIPYFIIPVYAALARFDTRYLEASRDLGAGTGSTFRHVTLPMSRQGLLAGTVVVALPMFGDFFTNGLLSGVSSTGMVGTLINTYSESQTDQAVAAALAVWLTVFSRSCCFRTSAARRGPAGRSVREARLRHASWGKIGLATIVVLYIVWSLAPVLIAFLFSFNAGYFAQHLARVLDAVVDRPESVFHLPIYADAIKHSLLLAVLAVVITVPLGVSLSIFLSRWRGITARPVSFLATVPLVVPELVLALAMFFLVTKLVHVISLGTTGQVVGQVTFILPLVVVITIGRLSSIPTGFEEAVRISAPRRRSRFRLVLVPLFSRPSWPARSSPLPSRSTTS